MTMEREPLAGILAVLKKKQKKVSTGVSFCGEDPIMEVVQATPANNKGTQDEH